MSTAKPDYYWLPFMALFSGARIGELAALGVPDIKQEGGIWYFDITEEDDDGVKKDNSVRKVPIHKILIDLGLLDYKASLKDKQGLLFPHSKKAINGYGKNMSRRFNEEYLPKRLLIKHAEKKVYSFRSTFINRMTYMNVYPAIIVEHYKKDKVDFSSAHFSVYQQQKPIKVMKEVIDHLTYPELDFSLYTRK